MLAFLKGLGFFTILGYHVTSRRPCCCTAQKVLWEFDSVIMQNLSDILPFFCTPTWPSHHVSENQELSAFNQEVHVET